MLDTRALVTGVSRSPSLVSRRGIGRELLHYELVYNYSGSKHITESLKRCGISESSTYVLATYFNSSSDESSRETINGKEIDLEELGGRLDQAQIQKHYKITSMELGISSVADAIT
ncbi:hypothetical protein PRUPE_4G258000 [Prunus persica]|uniref:Uncharacterized protein n=1 Tax=Prunus persica TaxID=3760 RepID=M5WX21_PRUPE|nr:hypothetical protein PRUPE_4G258000 [Prunus persica]